MDEKQMKVLKLIQTHCINGKELDPTDIIRLEESLTMMEVLEAIPILENEGYIEVIEIDMCCGADYIITGITQKGNAFIN